MQSVSTSRIQIVNRKSYLINSFDPWDQNSLKNLKAKVAENFHT